MQTLSPSFDRIGAALKALRQTHAPGASSEDVIALGAKCLRVLLSQLGEEGVPQQDLQPLLDLENALASLKVEVPAQAPAPAPVQRNRRRQRPPSDILLARASAVIDLLIKAGHEENEAAQLVMRKLMAAGVPPPQQGGDARGWRRLLEWRADLGHGVGSADALAEYREFTQEIEAIPANERVKRVLDEQLWDRRRKPRDPAA
jgi:hypothetical protein